MFKCRRYISVAFHSIASHSIEVIPHGVPDLHYIRMDTADKNIIFPQKVVMLSNGLMHRYKGIEYVIRAMPEIMKHIPNIVYLIQGLILLTF